MSSHFVLKSLPLQNHYHATVGYDDVNYLKSTEFVYTDGVVEAGPDLPEARNGHCMTQMNATHYIIMGGQLGKSGKKTNTTIIYDSTTKTYSDGPEMPYAIKTFACTVFWSDLHYRYISETFSLKFYH